MILFHAFAILSIEIHIDQLKMNKSVIFGLVLKNQFDHSPISLHPERTFQSTTFFKRVNYYYSSSQFLRIFSKQQSFYFTDSIFKNILNNVVSSERYEYPDFNETIFYESPYKEGRMVTFRRCYFYDINSLNNINNQPALHTTSQIFRVYSCVFRNCMNNGDGGAIHSEGTEFLLVNDCDFISCSATGRGGAFSCHDSALIVFRNAFQFCVAGSIGGAFFYEDYRHTWDLIIQSNLFTRCKAGSYLYFYAQFHKEENNTCYLYFNKFQCLKSEVNDYFVIKIQDNRDADVSKFRNAYGDDNYNIHLPPTKTFSPLPTQTPTQFFSPSIGFSPSNGFSGSDYFTKSDQFTSTQNFTKSEIFTQSFAFTSSSDFTPSKTLTPVPSRTVSASHSIFPTLTRSPSIAPSRSPPMTGTPTFTDSMPFTPPASPYATGTPTLSKTPCITWPNLSLGLLILLGIILLLGIIANIYLIMLCCKPSEIFVQQVL